MSISIVGPWEGGPEGYRGQFVFTDTHYCGFFVAADRKPLNLSSLRSNSAISSDASLVFLVETVAEVEAVMAASSSTTSIAAESNVSIAVKPRL